MKIVYFVLAVFLFFSCGEDINYRNYLDSNINIYLVKSGEITGYDSNVDLNSLKLESNAWVKSSEIDLYDWSSHTFYLNTKKEKGKYSGRHFVVVSGDERLFLGVFFPMYMSSFPQIPSILPMDEPFSPGDIIKFRQLGHQFTGDINKFDNFKKALISSGLLHNGIKVELRKVQKKNSTTIAYTYEVTNLDTETLYLLDPDKMGDSRFHYVTIGANFVQNNTCYFPQNIEHTSFETVHDRWYFKLKPGQKMMRTVELSDFSTLPSGTVKCWFSFPGSVIKSGEWKKPGGRIWLGDYFIEKELELN